MDTKTIPCENAEYHIANPAEAWHVKRLFAFQFGAIGTTRVLVWARSMDDALEEAGEYLSEEYPGHLMAHDSAELREQYEMAAEELDLDLDDLDEDDESKLHEEATTDLTYTEAGYLNSSEWWVDDVHNDECLRNAMVESLLLEDMIHGWQLADVKKWLTKHGASATDAEDDIDAIAYEHGLDPDED